MHIYTGCNGLNSVLTMLVSQCRTVVLTLL